MTRTIEIDDAQGHLRELVQLASSGVEIILVNNERPVARIIAIGKEEFASENPRTPGLSRGAVQWISPDFDDPLPEEFWLGRNEAPA